MTDVRLSAGEVRAAIGQLPDGAGAVALLQEKDRNQVFAVGEHAIFKAYLSGDGMARQDRKIAVLGFLAGRGLPVPRLLGHGVIAAAGGAVPWTLETRVVTGHVRPSPAELGSAAGLDLHRALGRWLPNLHALGGFSCFGSWQSGGPSSLAAHVLPRARDVRARAAGLDGVPPALIRRVCHELDRLEPAIRDAGWLRPRLLHGDYGTNNAAARPADGGRMEVAGVFDFEAAVPGDPLEDLLLIADHGLRSPIFLAFLDGYLERGQLDDGAPERFAFYQLERCLAILPWARQAHPEYFAQAQWLIGQVTDGGRLAG